jgi:cytochrome c-type biogenesis protein CcmH/NrfF
MRSPRLMLVRSLALPLVLGACLFACHPADDAESVRAREAHEIARDLMSPFCPGRTLAECSSPDAGAVREEIRESLRQGESPASIRARIQGRFGDYVLGVPRGRVGWAIPILALVAGAGALALVLRRAVQRPRALPTPIPPEVESQLARELDDVEPD